MVNFSFACFTNATNITRREGDREVPLLAGSIIIIFDRPFCILFLTFANLIMYRETARHKDKIKTQHLPQEDVERFLKENKALKTTLFVVGAVLVCLLPVGFFFIVVVTGLHDIFPINVQLMQTCAMLNSLVNPLIYCWRQKEMRNVIFGMRTQAVRLDIQNR